MPGLVFVDFCEMKHADIKNGNCKGIFKHFSLYLLDDRAGPHFDIHRVIGDWLEHINDAEITAACLLEISMCFDSINHIILLRKLEMYGIIGSGLNWFFS